MPQTETVQPTNTTEPPMSEEQLEAATRPTNKDQKESGDQPKVDVAAVAANADKPAQEQTILTSPTPAPTPAPKSQPGQPQQNHQSGKPQHRDNRPHRDNRDNRQQHQAQPPQSVGNQIKGLDKLGPVAEGLAKDTELKVIQARLELIREAKSLVGDIIRIWNAGDREFAKKLFAFVVGE